MPTPGPRPVDRSDLSPPKIHLQVIEKRLHLVLDQTTTSRTNDIRTTTDKVNNITTSHDDDETRGPQSSRGPEDEVVGPRAKTPTTIIPHCLRRHQEAVLAGHENVVHLLLWIPFKWSRYDYGMSSTSNITILAPRLLMVEVRLRLVFYQQRSDPRTTTSNGQVILVPRLPMVELRLRLVLDQQRSGSRTSISSGRVMTTTGLQSAI
uniref:Uncharacterized protein n=1 Tax=Oryza sativa subsp. japonica TaxID=39947 RepID=Q69K89_ORYSJ|nr:hypothetical protein [Oryza sativa Japonica Group]